MVIVLLLGGAMMPVSAQSSVDQAVSSVLHPELKSLCDLIASGKLTREQSEQLLRRVLHEDEHAEFGGEIAIAMLASFTLIVGILGCYYKCCKDAASCGECCNRCSSCYRECQEGLEDTRHNNDSSNYLA